MTSRLVAGGDLLAVIADSTRRDGRSLNAIERLRQDARGRSFADTARADEKIGMREPVLLDRVFQRLRDMILSDQIVKSLRPIFPGKNLVAHASNLNALNLSRKQKINRVGF